ncbi:tripartite tricarboxylate transporter substrate binding protein [Sediminicoccus rosea]|jgi:tripartite-type tricarboxylate transporter receptor subunit TctC|uniref:Tripartite tricarboxylate transporter substrate binding protein n=1 Tax=Sediminicoccus rosea TaxID=1225128 RepID=A0ABZ0PK58_9PROT|nr:tripartite tricarboxylate transporter substrate binding protein [Sediminicoccus rosea]WPB85752.1 tripartite tricarboxylate transporter substrate binding protein [Sediminicoccus rosea]
MRWITLMLAAMLALPAAAQSQGEAYPSRAVQLIIPFPPGGNTDLMARALQAELSKALGQQVVAVNRGGAAGAIGNAELARARPDGYTIGISPNNAITTQPFLQNVTYTPESFRYLCLVYDNPQVLILGRNAPFRDFAGMIAHARSGREALVFGSPGVGSTQHILIAQLLRAAGVDGLNVPFTGAGPMSQAALAGQIMAFVEAASIPASTGLPVLAVLGTRRMAALPDVPSTGELGYPMAGTTYGGLIAPAGLPDAIAETIERACRTAVTSEGFRTIAERLNAVPSFQTGAEFRARFIAESQVNRALLADLGIQRQ